MALVFTGKEFNTLSGVSFQAKDTATGKSVTVLVSHEVLQDYGADQAKIKANEKYGLGKLEQGGSVHVMTIDF